MGRFLFAIPLWFSSSFIAAQADGLTSVFGINETAYITEAISLLDSTQLLKSKDTIVFLDSAKIYSLEIKSNKKKTTCFLTNDESVLYSLEMRGGHVKVRHYQFETLEFYWDKKYRYIEWIKYISKNETHSYYIKFDVNYLLTLLVLKDKSNKKPLTEKLDITYQATYDFLRNSCPMFGMFQAPPRKF